MFQRWDSQKPSRNLQRTISPYGDLINRIVEVKKAQGELNSKTEEASLRQSLYNQALAIMFPNVRGIRSVLGLLSDNYQDYEEILTAILNKELTLDDALKKADRYYGVSERCRSCIR